MAKTVELTTPGIEIHHQPLPAAWDGISQDVRGFTGREILVKGGLNWGVKKRPMFCYSADDEKGLRTRIEIPRRYAIVRQDNNAVLGDVGEGYTPQTNEELVSIADAIVGEKAANYEAAGLLRGGAQVWILMKITGVLRVLGTDDTIDRYMLLHNSFNGSTLVRFCLTMKRFWCGNQLLTVEKQADHVTKARHTKGIGEKILEIRESLRVVPKFWADMQDKINAMAKAKISPKALDLYFQHVMGVDPEAEKGKQKSTYDSLVEAFENSPGNTLPGVKGTLWAAFNAVTWHSTHLRTVRGTEGPQGEKEARLASLFGGRANDLNQKAWEEALINL